MPNSAKPRKCCGEFPLEITGEYRPDSKWIKFECPVCGNNTQSNPTAKKYKYSGWNKLAAETFVKRAMKTPGGPERIAEAIELNIPMDLTAIGACHSCGSTIKNLNQVFCMICGQKLKFN